jgi:hypothetical protein
MRETVQQNTTYQAVLVNRSSGLATIANGQYQSNEQAHAWARSLAISCRVELWHNERMIGTFPPTGEVRRYNGG